MANIAQSTIRITTDMKFSPEMQQQPQKWKDSSQVRVEQGTEARQRIAWVTTEREFVPLALKCINAIFTYLQSTDTRGLR